MVFVYTVLFLVDTLGERRACILNVVLASRLSSCSFSVTLPLTYLQGRNQPHFLEIIISDWYAPHLHDGVGE